MAVELELTEIESSLHNSSVNVGDIVFAQDLVDDEMGLPLEVYHTAIYKVMRTVPVGQRIDVILSDGIVELAVDLSELMEHGIVGIERLTVVSQPKI